MRRTVEEAGRASHVEVTNLLIPGRNDSEEEIAALVEWLAERVGPDTPLHFSRYFPRYRYQLPPTPLATLRRARELAERRLRYVYLGNVWEEEGNDTRCPRCGEAVIERRGYSVRTHLDGARCGYCGYRLPIVM
ncbi:MAG: hypothetical protein QJR13_07560 [Bacillota bacterium]|nr:hypothetical protein [Bacillota bacterium]